jgi:hypothetical protein
MGVLVSRFRVLIGLLTVLLSTHRVSLRFLMITVVMMVGRLVMMMSRSLMLGSRIVMMVTRSMLFIIRHEKLLARNLRRDALPCFRQSRNASSATTSSSEFGAKGPFGKPRVSMLQRPYLESNACFVLALFEKAGSALHLGEHLSGPPRPDASSLMGRHKSSSG